jgi:hypothetical protein
MQNTPHTPGMLLGASAGIYKSWEEMDFTLNLFQRLSWEDLLQTAILAFIGAIVGWLGTAIMNYLKRLFIKLKNK